MPTARAEKEIDEARAGDLHPAAKPAGIPQNPEQGFCHLARRLFFLPGQNHRQVGRQIPVPGMRRLLQDQCRESSRVQHPLAITFLQSLRQIVVQLFFHRSFTSDGGMMSATSPLGPAGRTGGAARRHSRRSRSQHWRGCPEGKAVYVSVTVSCLSRKERRGGGGSDKKRPRPEIGADGRG